MVYYANVQSIKHYVQQGGERMGYKVREAREAVNMTQEELAEKSGVSRGTICAIEKGTTRGTTTKTLLKLARALGTTVDQIFFADSV